MSTPTHSELVTVDRADIERIHHALMDLWNSASTEGCEEPYGVIDMTHLNTLKSVLLPLRQKLDEVNSQAEQRDSGGSGDGVPPLVGEPSGKEVTVVVEAFETSQWGADGPQFMSLCVTQKFLTEMASRVADMSRQGVDSISLSRYPEDWGPGNIDVELRLQNSEMVVTSRGNLWFEDRPKNADYLIQSREVSIEDLRKAFEASEHLGTQFISYSGYDGSVRELASMYWDDECEKALRSFPAGDEPDPASTTPHQLRYARALAAVEALAADDDEGDDVTPVSPASN
jgi:hypothetical protein